MVALLQGLLRQQASQILSRKIYIPWT
jgi:hypothetical protein